MKTTRYVRNRHARQARRRARLDAVAFAITMIVAAIALTCLARSARITRPPVLPPVAEWGSCKTVQDACEAHGTPFVALWAGPAACTVSFRCGRLIELGHCHDDTQEGC